MPPIPTIQELQRALHIQENIEKLQHELGSIFGRAGAKILGAAESGMRAATKGIQSIKVPRKKSKMSAKGRAAIVAAQKKRWAKVKGKAKAAKPAKTKKRKISAAHRAAIVKAQKARWKKLKAEKEG